MSCHMTARYMILLLRAQRGRVLGARSRTMTDMNDRLPAEHVAVASQGLKALSANSGEITISTRHHQKLGLFPAKPRYCVNLKIFRKYDEMHESTSKVQPSLSTPRFQKVVMH